MSDKIKTVGDLAKFTVAIKRLSVTLDTLRTEIIALLHDKESLERENAYLRGLLDDKN